MLVLLKKLFNSHFVAMIPILAGYQASAVAFPKDLKLDIKAIQTTSQLLAGQKKV
jgi:hypothetical protein